MDKYKIVEYNGSKKRNQQENIKHKVGRNQEPTKIIVCGKDGEVKRSIKADKRK